MWVSIFIASKSPTHHAPGYSTGLYLPPLYASCSHGMLFMSFIRTGDIRVRHRGYEQHHRHISPKSKICSLRREGSLQRCCCWTSGAEGKRATGLGAGLRWHRRCVHSNWESLPVSVLACMQQYQSHSKGGEWMDRFNLEGRSHYTPSPYRHVVAALQISIFLSWVFLYNLVTRIWYITTRVYLHTESQKDRR